MANLAFLGLGQMGGPMALRLIEAGHDVTVWNRSRDKARPHEEMGARVAATPAQAAAGAEAVFTMLATPEAVSDVVLGPDGVGAGIGPDALLVEMSTVGPNAIKELKKGLGEDVTLVDAPVLGSVPQAESGELQIFVGAEPEVFERLKPLLEPMGTSISMGPLGSGAAMKLVVNSTLGSLITTLGEAVLLADALGLDREAVLERLAESPLRVTVGRKKEKILSGSYPPDFKLALARKDMKLVEEAARASGVDLRVNEAAATWIAEADEAGLGDLDYSAVIAHVLGDEARP